ncbi:DUF1570 domain-containing protein [Tautonia sociabilis]|uniref:DUF1570 domain-containing protein n=1 Tax=Tautonia sociabilis TaxID=2080755 RepID=A0A432MNN5_9BACT|nr:DUF1570 domain-containing protein [Tautonia sociabilis]RUL88930.1 DUF1570 domain-containing protein [Tautonia sociabilis]
MLGRGTRVGLLLLLAVAPASSPRPARGELVYFRAGGEVQLPVEKEGDTIRLLRPGGPVVFRSEDVARIVPGHWPAREWPALRDKALAGDASSRYRACWWALERGLTPEAVALLRSSHEADPDLEPVARMVAMLDRLDRPGPEPDLGPLRAVLPEGEFSISRRGRLVLLHQHSQAEADERLALLDRVLTTFYLTFTALGFDLRTPPEPLVSVWFAEEADYLSYLRREAGDAFLTTRGYYHPTRRVVFVYDGRSREDHRDAEQSHRARIDELDRAQAELDRSPPGARIRLAIAGEPPRTLDLEEAAEVIDRLRRDSAREALLRELNRERVDRGAAVHELVHQLVLASGLAPGYDRFPVWLHEGIAMQFEAFRGSEWAGLGEIPGHRLDHWRRLGGPPALLPLIRDEGFGRGYAPDRYAAAWALVHYLRTEHPGRFVSFLDRLRNPSLGVPDRAETAFRTAVASDLSDFRASWVAHLSGLRTPIEESRPAEPAKAPAPRGRRRRRRLPRRVNLVD